MPDRSIFRKLARRLQIPSIDRRGKTFSSRSARKWLSTALTEAGVPTLLVDTFLRHRAHVGQVYSDVSFASQLLALQRLPTLFGDAQTYQLMQNISDYRESGVDKPPIGREGVDARTMETPPTKPNTSNERAAPAASWFSQITAKGAVRSLESDSGEFHPGPAGSSHKSGYAERNPGSGMNAAIADLLDAAARVLRGGVA